MADDWESTVQNVRSAMGAETTAPISERDQFEQFATSKLNNSLFEARLGEKPILRPGWAGAPDDAELSGYSRSKADEFEEHIKTRYPHLTDEERKRVRGGFEDNLTGRLR